MFIKASIAFALILTGFLTFIALQPSDMNISRELLIQANPQKIFPHINNSQKANDWMPWSESDPQVQMQFSGPAAGIGSISSWISKGKMGTGQAIVVESIPNKSVKTKLTYTQPMTMEQMAEVSLSPTDGGTLVRWSVSGKNSFIGRIFCFFLNMDKEVGGQFEKGLRKLKAQVEGK